LAKAEGKSFEEFEHEFFDKVRPTSLIKRFATPEEVASLVVFIASHCRRRQPAQHCALTAV